MSCDVINIVAAVLYKSLRSLPRKQAEAVTNVDDDQQTVAKSLHNVPREKRKPRSADRGFLTLFRTTDWENRRDQASMFFRRRAMAPPPRPIRPVPSRKRLAGSGVDVVEPQDDGALKLPPVP